jgi:hypothetical protein
MPFRNRFVLAGLDPAIQRNERIRWNSGLLDGRLEGRP